MIKYFISSRNCTIFFGSETKTISSNHVNFKEVCELLKAKCDDVEKIKELINTKQVLMNAAGDMVYIKDGQVYLKNSNACIQNILDEIFHRIKEEQSISVYLKFINNVLAKGLDDKSLKTLLKIIHKEQLEFSENGDLIAYCVMRHLYGKYSPNSGMSIIEVKADNIFWIGDGIQIVDLCKVKTLADEDHAGDLPLSSFTTVQNGFDWFEGL